MRNYQPWQMPLTDPKIIFVQSSGAKIDSCFDRAQNDQVDKDSQGCAITYVKFTFHTFIWCEVSFSTYSQFSKKQQKKISSFTCVMKHKKKGRCEKWTWQNWASFGILDLALLVAIFRIRTIENCKHMNECFNLVHKCTFIPVKMRVEIVSF